MKPSELILSALSACSSVDVVQILEKKKTPLTSLEVTVTADQDKDPPWAFRKIHLHFKLKGNNLVEKDVAYAIQLSEHKYCSVAATLRGVAKPPVLRYSEIGKTLKVAGSLNADLKFYFSVNYKAALTIATKFCL